jgi:hypothetical protein
MARKSAAQSTGQQGTRLWVAGTIRNSVGKTGSLNNLGVDEVMECTPRKAEMKIDPAYLVFRFNHMARTCWRGGLLLIHGLLSHYGSAHSIR